jgi:RNA polymerase sigma factor (sigma-70 family)
VNELTNQQLLRDYAQSRSESAFTELVRRHVDLVHSAAFRMTGEMHSAQDITQAVFLALAQNAARLTNHPVLSGWLHTTARNLAAKQIRAAVRRQNHEQEAAAMSELLAAEPEADWNEIAPHLDAALGELSEPDRDAVLLRYFQRKTSGEIGGLIGISEAAAQKRISRAVEQLREFFAKRGITVGASGLAVAISANAVQAAPVGLALTISTAATLAGTTLATTATITATKVIAMTTLPKTIVTVTVAILAGIGIYVARENTKLRDHIKLQDTHQKSLATRLEQLSADQEYTQQQLAAARETNEQLNRDREELLKLRADVANHRPQQLANGGNPPPFSNPYGLKPEETPPFISSNISRTAKTYGYFITQSEKGELSKAQAFLLAKAWPYIEKRFHDPESFAQFQSDYLAAVFDIKDKDAIWKIRRALEDARNVEHAKGLVSARTASELQRQRPQVPEQFRKQFEQRVAAIDERWAALNEELSAKVLDHIPENQRSMLQTWNWKLLDFDPRLKAAAKNYANVAESEDFATEELFQASQLPGEKAVYGIIGTQRQQ